MQLQIGVKVIITDESGNMLVLQRAKSDQHDIAETWDIPGGRINVDESLETALKRELREEIGVVPDEIPLLIAAQDIFVTKRDIHVVRLTYRLTITRFVPTLSEEHSAFQWVSPHDLTKLNLDNITRQAVFSASDIPL